MRRETGLELLVLGAVTAAALDRRPTVALTDAGVRA
jgi:hypothetical protein